MSKLTPYFTIERSDDMTVESLLEVIDRMYSDLAEAINSKPDIYQRDVDGQTTDTFLANGTLNLNTDTNKVEILCDHVDSSTVTWKTLG